MRYLKVFYTFLFPSVLNSIFIDISILFLSIMNTPEFSSFFNSKYRASFFLALGFSVFFLILFLPICSFPTETIKILAVAFLMLYCWITQTLPMSVVAIFPLFLFPLLGISSLDKTALPYASPIVFLFMGGFLLGIAIEKWQLHRRIALYILLKTGTRGDHIILGFIISTGLISMWLSNTATAMMMFPIALSVNSVMHDYPNSKGNRRNFSVALLLSIAYASNFGGIATLIGTPPNIAYVGYYVSKYGQEIGFSTWMLFSLPLSILLLWLLYLVLTKWLYRNNMEHNDDIQDFVKKEWSDLGLMSLAEKRVLYVFLATAFLWMFRSLINQSQHFFVLDDTIIALVGSTSLFAIPSGFFSEQGRSTPLLDAQDVSKVSWGILLLFGGGLALANALEHTGLIDILGKKLLYFSDQPWMVVFLVVIVSVFLSELMSNVALVMVLAPVTSVMAESMHMNSLLLGIPMTIAASCAGMLPMGTPPNAIVFASGALEMLDFIKVGLVMNIVSIVLIVLFSWFLIPILF